MRIIILLILLSLLFGCIVPLGPGNALKERLENYMNEKGIEGNVSVYENYVIILFDATNETNAEMLSIMYSLANKSREIDSRNVRIEALKSGKPYYALEYTGKIYLQDIRSPEWRIADEMSLFDFVGSIRVSDSYIVFKGQYIGTKEDFLNQLLSFSAIIFENAPWVNKAIFLVGPINITVFKSDLLDYLLGNVSEDGLLNKFQFSENSEYEESPTFVLADDETMLKDSYSEDCGNKNYSYKQYVKYYNIVTTMMNRQNNGETINQSELMEAYSNYTYWKSCYENLSKN